MVKGWLQVAGWVAVVVLCGIVRPAAPRAEAVNAPPVVVELFTSEGCSSCPPADALLRRLANMQPADGRPVIALSEHVTYWNHLGWSDPFSAETFTERQNRYSTRFRLDTVYTPQVVVNGRSQFVGNDEVALERALHAEGRRPALTLRLTDLHRDGDSLGLRVNAGQPPGAGDVELWAGLVDDEDSSDVTRGENSGRVLRHVAVVRTLQRVSTLHAAGEQTLTAPVPETVWRKGGTRHHVVLLAQLPGQGAIVWAASAAF